MRSASETAATVVFSLLQASKKTPAETVPRNMALRELLLSIIC
jgi:hypothetical protein